MVIGKYVPRQRRRQRGGGGGGAAVFRRGFRGHGDEANDLDSFHLFFDDHGNGRGGGGGGGE